MIKSVGLIQPSVNDRGYVRNGGDDLKKSVAKTENKINESNNVPYRISKTKRNSPSNTNLDQYRR